MPPDGPNLNYMFCQRVSGLKQSLTPGHELRSPWWMFWPAWKQHFLLSSLYISASVFNSPSAQHTASFADGGLISKEHQRKAAPMGTEGQLLLLAAPLSFQGYSYH